jgi:hypothetical protein
MNGWALSKIKMLVLLILGTTVYGSGAQRRTEFERSLESTIMGRANPNYKGDGAAEDSLRALITDIKINNHGPVNIAKRLSELRTGYIVREEHVLPVLIDFTVLNLLYSPSSTKETFGESYLPGESFDPSGVESMFKQLVNKNSQSARETQFWLKLWSNISTLIDEIFIQQVNEEDEVRCKFATLLHDELQYNRAVICCVTAKKVMDLLLLFLHCRPHDSSPLDSAPGDLSGAHSPLQLQSPDSYTPVEAKSSSPLPLPHLDFFPISSDSAQNALVLFGLREQHISFTTNRDYDSFRATVLSTPRYCQCVYHNVSQPDIAIFFLLLAQNNETFSGTAMGIITYEIFRLHHWKKVDPSFSDSTDPVDRAILDAVVFEPNWNGSMLDIVNIVRTLGPTVFDALIFQTYSSSKFRPIFDTIRSALIMLARGMGDFCRLDSFSDDQKYVALGIFHLTGYLP